MRRSERAGDVAILAGLLVGMLAVGACSPGPRNAAADGDAPVAVEGAPTPTQKRATAAARAGTVAAPTLADAKPRDLPGIHNVVAYHDGLYSGGAPEGDAAFDTIAAMGVRTVISVDGAVPDVEAAGARGLKYIHLPIGYNGFDETRKRELVRATRDALKEGPVYIHCHHGKHRSAGAAGTIVAALGWASPEAMVERMKVSGTAANYTGLYRCTATATVLGADEIDAMPASYPSISRPGTFVAAMVEVDMAFDHLKAIQRAGWTVPADHPDLVPAAEAGRLADALRISAESSYAKRKPADFAAALSVDSDRAQAIENILAALKSGEKPDVAKLDAGMKLLAASCKDCHAKYRD